MKKVSCFLSFCFFLCLSSCQIGEPSFASLESKTETDSSTKERDELSSLPNVISESSENKSSPSDLSSDDFVKESSFEDHTKPAPMISIIDDDGGKHFLKYLLPLVEKGIPISAAIITNWVGSGNKVMDWKDIEQIKSKGAEILSHSHTHKFAEECSEMSQEEIDLDYKLSKETLQLHGIDCDTIVYPGNSAFYQGCIDAAKKVFSYGFRPGTDKTNYYHSIEPLEMDRWGVTTDCKYEYLTSIIDKLVGEKTGYMVWMIHTSFESFNQHTADVVEKAVNYAKEKGVEIVSTRQGIQTYVDSNVIQDI